MRRYSFLLALLVLMAGGPAAVVTLAQTPDGQFVVSCSDGRQVVGLRVSLQDLTPGGEYRVTLLGETGFDPALAVVRGDGTTTCSDNEGVLTGVQLGLGNIGRWQANAFSTQVTIVGGPDTNVELVVGGFAGESGQFALVVEGFTIDPLGESDAIYVDVPPSIAGEWLGVFMIGSGDLDPFLELATLDADGIYTTAATCDNGNVRECDNVPALTENGIAFEEANQVVGDAFDAGLLTAPQAGRLWYTFGAARGASTGAYTMFLTGMAPGDPAERAYVCDNVASSIVSASPTYNELYAPENVLDGDPSTRWVTSARTAAGQSPFIVVGLSDTVVVDSVRINGFVNQRRTNSLKTFDIAVPNPERQTTVAMTAEAALRPGYQSFRITPARVQEIGFVLNATQGGGLFEIFDVQVCAARGR